MNYKLTEEQREFFLDVAKRRVVFHHAASIPGYVRAGENGGFKIERYCGQHGTGYRLHFYNPSSPGQHMVEYYLIPVTE